MRVVVNTNVIVSSFLAPNGAAANVLTLCEKLGFDIVVSGSILAEYVRALRYPKVRSIHRKSDADIATSIRRLYELSTRVTPRQHLTVVPNDPDDDKFFECAVAGKADYIVSDDKHLLALGSYEGIQVLPPAVFVRLFAEKDEEETAKDESASSK